jgi:hypothetical protein
VKELFDRLFGYVVLLGGHGGTRTRVR